MEYYLPNIGLMREAKCTFTLCAGFSVEPWMTVAHERVSSINASGVVFAWTRGTFIHIYAE
jgi:hypothetical protein